jgi:hypothetical protein
MSLYSIVVASNISAAAAVDWSREEKEEEGCGRRDGQSAAERRACVRARALLCSSFLKAQVTTMLVDSGGQSKTDRSKSETTKISSRGNVMCFSRGARLDDGSNPCNSRPGPPARRRLVLVVVVFFFVPPTESVQFRSATRCRPTTGRKSCRQGPDSKSSEIRGEKSRRLLSLPRFVYTVAGVNSLFACHQVQLALPAGVSKKGRKIGGSCQK